jgi:hypothetical protein
VVNGVEGSRRVGGEGLMTHKGLDKGKKKPPLFFKERGLGVSFFSGLGISFFPKL